MTWQQVVAASVIAIAVIVVAWGRSAAGKQTLERVYGPLASAPLFAKRAPRPKRSRTRSRAASKPTRKPASRRATTPRRGATRAR